MFVTLGCGFNQKPPERMDPKVIEKVVQEMADFTPDMGEIEGVPLLKGICDVWDTIHNFQARDGDIVVASYPKSGTTWMQEILDLIVLDGDVEKSLRAPGFVKVPFLEMGHTSLEVANTMSSPRILKTHLPVQLMPPSFWEKDVKKQSDWLLWATAPLFLCTVTWGNWFDHVIGWWKAKERHKILYVFYEDMIEDSPREIHKVMRFLGKDLPEDVVQKILHHTSFQSMKNNPMFNFSALSETVFDQSVSTFMRKGIVGDWKNHFHESQNLIFDKEYEEKMEGSGLAFRTEL
ncbi:sulfotransferase 1C1-like [Hyla sarda]|uniref:sulfotransferase 1C1-like n=1 Tax=Hyla sarda TaxID=327740 RepID=UPI0024C3B534|nr:sulfotransferase 1C1-like [Hyla sarda]